MIEIGIGRGIGIGIGLVIEIEKDTDMSALYLVYSTPCDMLYNSRLLRHSLLRGKNHRIFH